MLRTSGICASGNCTSRSLVHSRSSLAAAVAAAFTLAHGLPAHAAAQDPARATVRSSVESRVAVAREVDGRRVSVDLENGRVARATVDGQDVPAERVRMVDGGVEILAEDGSVLERIDLPGVVGRGAAGAEGAGGSGSGSGARREMRVRVGRADGNEPIVVEGQPLGAMLGGGGTVVAVPVPKAMMGVGLGPVDEALAAHLSIDASRATILTNVLDDMPAAKAGLRRFDVIVSIGGAADASPEALREALRGLEPGAKVALGYRRGAESGTVEVEMVAFDAEKVATLETFGAAMPGVDVEELDVDAMAVFEGDEIGAGGAGTRMFFVGPDGRQREVRVPRMPGALAMPRREAWAGSGVEAEDFAQSMREFSRRMEEWSARIERGMRDGRGRWFEGADGPERGEGGAVDGRRDAGRRDGSRGAGPGSDADAGGAAGADARIRRLEEAMGRMSEAFERMNAGTRSDGAMRRGSPSGELPPRGADRAVPGVPPDDALRGMSSTELRELLSAVAIARSERGLSDEVRARLERDFERLLEALRASTAGRGTR